jgi:hypothetical protein
METQAQREQQQPQAMPAIAEPQKEHEWLQQLVGEWTYEAECVMGQDKPPEKSKGTESVRTLGGLWVLCEGSGEMPGGGMATTLMTLGYDPQKQHYVGTFVASMMTYLWIYEKGSLDAEGKVLTLNAEGPSCAGDGKFMKYQDRIEIKNNDHRVMTSHTLGEDGQWHQFMTVHYGRKK